MASSMRLKSPSMISGRGRFSLLNFLVRFLQKFSFSLGALGAYIVRVGILVSWGHFTVKLMACPGTILSVSSILFGTMLQFLMITIPLDRVFSWSWVCVKLKFGLNLLFRCSIRVLSECDSRAQSMAIFLLFIW